ncbi:MAG: NUDIX domain-containing protein [Deltaproteobacteria bacterium]|nr:NUDIX domain-containing protein [Deltaproteobacteria bacterium]NIS76597.1 NUDIX domain-containing protein [Deltaproteobacteria bacterium]
MKENTSQRNPFPAADVIIEMDRGIILVKRKNPPHGWAIPGGFIETGETAEEAALREAAEETGLDVSLTDLLGVYSMPGRDPRFHTLSVVYVGKGSGIIKAGDDAQEAGIYTEENLPLPLAFDHEGIIRDYFRFKKTGYKPEPRASRKA